MEVAVRMDKCDSLAHVEKIADEARERHAVGIVLTLKLQPPDVSALDVRLREKRPAILGCAQVIKRNKVGVAKLGSNLGHLKKPRLVIWVVRTIDNDFSSQDPVEGEPSAMWPIEPQLIAQVVPLLKWNGVVKLHEASSPSSKGP